MKYATLPIKYLKNLEDDDIDVDIEESTEFCARISSKKGRYFFIGADLGINSSSSCRVSDDKLYSYYFLEKDGINIIDSIPTESLDHLSKVDFPHPYIIKPNHGLGGDGFLIISSNNDLNKAYEYTKKYSDIIIAQKYITKPEYRVVVFNGSLYFAYERTKYKIIGDGKSSIEQIIVDRNLGYRDAQKINISDYRMEFELNKSGLNLNHILKAGEEIYPFGNSNLKCGGGWNDVTDIVHERYIEVASQCASSLGLCIAGIDIFAESITEFDPNYSVIEVNSRPGFEYIRSNENSLNRLFKDILEYMK